jgi:hypothetical protein
MRIWFVPALGAVMVIAAVIASRMPAEAAAAAATPVTPVVIAPPAVRYAEPPLPAPSASLTGVPACDAYVEQLRSLEQCREFPAQSRENLEEGISAIQQAVRSENETARSALVSACQQGTDAIEQARKSMSC